MERVFTPEESKALWEIKNYNGYVYYGPSPVGSKAVMQASKATLEEIITSADKDISEGKEALRLRFSHDTGILPLLCLMGVNHFGKEVDDPEKVKNYWRSFDIPMGCNLQLIFYKSKRSDEILVKPLLNGKEATLPFPSFTGPYYSWSDLKAYYSEP